MIIKAYKTHKIVPNENIFEILDRYLPPLKEKSIVAIASKIVGVCEGRIIKKSTEQQKDEIIKNEAEYYLPQHHMGFLLTINQNILVANAGVDESNANGFLSLWPKDPQTSVNKIREYLKKKHNIRYLGVILTDSKLTALRYGVTAYGLTHSGFQELNSYIDKPDLFGRKFKVEKSNILDSLATTAAVVMGEGAEQQPLAVITDVPFVKFQTRNPTKKELEDVKIKPKDDIFGSILTAVRWIKNR